MNDNFEQGPSESKGPLEQTLMTLRRHRRLIVLCVVITGIVAIFASVIQTKQYTSTASLLFRENTAATSIFGSNNASPVGTDAIREAATNVELVSLKVVSAKTADAIGEGMSADDVQAAVAVGAQGQSDLVLVGATDPDPALAREIANTFAAEFIKFRAKADRSQLLKAKRLAEQEYASLSSQAKEGPRGAQLSTGAERLGILASLQTGNAELVQPAELPGSPTSPKPIRNALVGLFLGLLLGVALAFLSERLNRQLRTPEEAEASFGYPVLGEIPESRAITESNAGHGRDSLPFVEEEAFRLVRASLRYFSVDADIRILLVTSGTAGAGKTTLAWNLARVAARSSRVVLLETDLRNPGIARMDSQLAGPGLAEMLTHQVTLDEATQTVDLGTPDTPSNGTPQGAPQPSLDVITAGSTPPNPAELLESQGMADVLVQLRERYEFVVVDTPPIAVVSDTFPLIGQVDGVIVVARMKMTSRESAEELRDQLTRLDAPMLGVVANGVKTGRAESYGYGYSHDADQEAGASGSAGQRQTTGPG